jgi:phage gpG-like protein
MAGPVAVRVEGLRELQKALKEVDGKLHREIRLALNEGAKVVADAANPTIPRVSGNLAASVRPSSTQREGRVTMGTGAVPYAGWIEFGGKIPHRGGGVSVRPFIRQGRYLFPAAVRKTDEVVEICDRAVSQLIVRAGLG